LIQIQNYKDHLTRKLVKVMREEQPDYVFASLMPINIRVAFASALFPKIKVILRSNNYLYTLSFLQKARMYLAYRFLDHLIVQTDEMRDEHIKVLHLNEDKVVTLANPINIDQIRKKLEGATSPFEGSATNYVYVGRIDRIKGLDVLLKSFARLLVDEPDSLLYIVGQTDGVFKDFFAELTVLLAELKIGKNIIFTGFKDNPYQYMKFADCLVLPSRNEGLPNVVIESLYLNTPVAVTNSIPVIKRIVQEGVNGFVVEVDDVEGLAEAMKSASKLGRVQSTYTSATKEDFQRLFRNGKQ
jgi:glycosyltransferase involved in cell wall biosynthesis